MATSTPLFLLLVGRLILSVNCLTDPSVPASFFPFGTDENDNIVPVGDDVSSPAVSMSAGFPFLFGNYSRVFVSILSALQQLSVNQRFIIIIIIISNLYSIYYRKKNIGATVKKLRIKNTIKPNSSAKIDKLA